LIWIRTTLLVSVLIFTSCDIGEVPTASLNNSLDAESAAQEGIDTPALVFFPDNISTGLGGSVAFELFVMEVEHLTGASIKLKYDPAKLEMSSVNAGTFFTGANAPIFLFENDVDNGILHINTFYLGPDSLSVSGTGDLAMVVFDTKQPGQSLLQYMSESELADPDSNPIEIKGFGEGVIDAQ